MTVKSSGGGGGGEAPRPRALSFAQRDATYGRRVRGTRAALRSQARRGIAMEKEKKKVEEAGGRFDRGETRSDRIAGPLCVT